MSRLLVVAVVVLAIMWPVSAVVSYTWARAAHGLCVTLSGPGSLVLVPGRGC